MTKVDWFKLFMFLFVCTYAKGELKCYLRMLIDVEETWKPAARIDGMSGVRRPCLCLAGSHVLHCLQSLHLHIVPHL